MVNITAINSGTGERFPSDRMAEMVIFTTRYSAIGIDEKSRIETLKVPYQLLGLIPPFAMASLYPPSLSYPQKSTVFQSL